MARQQNKESKRAFLSWVLGLSYKYFADQKAIMGKLLAQKCLCGLNNDVMGLDKKIKLCLNTVKMSILM